MIKNKSERTTKSELTTIALFATEQQHKDIRLSIVTDCRH